MLIECILTRKNGTQASIDDTEYHFKPSNKDARHLCDVKNKRHISRFLSMPEAYQLADEEEFIEPNEDGALNLGDEDKQDSIKPTQTQAQENAEAKILRKDDDMMIEPDATEETLSVEPETEAPIAVNFTPRNRGKTKAKK